MEQGLASGIGSIGSGALRTSDVRVRGVCLWRQSGRVAPSCTGFPGFQFFDPFHHDLGIAQIAQALKQALAGFLHRLPVGIGIERRHGHVRHHHGIDPRRDGLTERRQFNGVKVGAVNVDAGDAEMRIGGRVAVTGEVLHCGQHSAFMRARDIGCDQIADLLGVFSERARVDDGIGRIRVHVGVGEEIPVNADGA